MQLHELGALEINQDLRRGETSPDEVAGYFQKRISEINPKLHAFLGTELKQPALIDPESSLIAGVPFAVKDNMVLAGRETSAASKILKGCIPPFTATVLTKLLASGGIILGRTNCDEFGM